MIRINLAIRRQASYLGSQTTKSGVLATSGKASTLAALRMFGNEAGSTALRRVMVPVILGVILHFGAEYYREQEIERMQDEKRSVETERGKIQEELKRIKGFESVKAELERNELIIKTKIATIEKLIRGRDFTLKSMVALTQALPENVWLSDVVVSDVQYTIKGSTSDLSLVSNVMNNLGKSIYFKDVTLKGSSVDGSGKFSNFELTARKE